MLIWHNKPVTETADNFKATFPFDRFLSLAEWLCVTLRTSVLMPSVARFELQIGEK